MQSIAILHNSNPPPKKTSNCISTSFYLFNIFDNNIIYNAVKILLTLSGTIEFHLSNVTGILNVEFIVAVRYPYWLLIILVFDSLMTYCIRLRSTVLVKMFRKFTAWNIQIENQCSFISIFMRFCLSESDIISLA